MAAAAPGDSGFAVPAVLVRGDALPGLLPAGRATMKKAVRLQAGRAGANAAGLQSSGTTLSIYRKIAKEYACASRNVPETGETKEDA